MIYGASGKGNKGILAAIIPIATALEQIGVAYYIGGSVVSFIYGIPRATFDVDLIADLHVEQVRPFVKQLEADYYINKDMIRYMLTQGQLAIDQIEIQALISADRTRDKVDQQPFDNQRYHKE